MVFCEKQGPTSQPFNTQTSHTSNLSHAAVKYLHHIYHISIAYHCALCGVARTSCLCAESIGQGPTTTLLPWATHRQNPYSTRPKGHAPRVTQVCSDNHYKKRNAGYTTSAITFVGINTDVLDDLTFGTCGPSGPDVHRFL